MKISQEIIMACPSVAVLPARARHAQNLVLWLLREGKKGFIVSRPARRGGKNQIFLFHPEVGAKLKG